MFLKGVNLDLTCKAQGSVQGVVYEPGGASKVQARVTKSDASL